ncbi:MAG: hypothetical protein MJ132_07860 [Clostridia bacterium]|nr:hypothetical protein [Clostridia bacterium]
MKSQYKALVLLASVLVAIFLFIGVTPLQNRAIEEAETLKLEQAQTEVDLNNSSVSKPSTDNDETDTTSNWDSYGFNEARGTNAEWMYITGYDFDNDRVYFNPDEIKDNSWARCSRIFGRETCTLDNWTADYRVYGNNKSNTITINRKASDNNSITIGNGGSYNISSRKVEATKGYVVLDVLYNISINSQPIRLTFIPLSMVDMSQAPPKTAKGYEYKLIPETQRAQ